MKIKTMYFVILLFIFCTAGLFFFFFKKFYEKEISLRLSPLMEDNRLVAAHTKYWMLGDSRIYQWPFPETLISKNQYCNLGINSQTSAQVLYRLGLHFEQAVPEYIFLQVGINDLKAIGVFPKKKEKIITACIKNIELIINTCITHKVIPVFCTIFPPGNISLIRSPIWSKEINMAVSDVNDSVTNYCKLNSIAIFDTYSALNDGKGTVIKKYQQDELHLNEEGYSKLNEELAKFLTKEKTVNK